MGTRIKKNPTNIYDVFCEVGIPSDNNKDPWISWKYPYSFKHEGILKSVPSFAYPCEFINNAVQHFSFVLTNIESQWTFGFCRHAANSSTCFVILSYLPWHEVFYKILNHAAELTNKAEAAKSKDLPLFLENLYRVQIPEPGLQMHVLMNKEKDFVATVPDYEKLPSIPENRNMTEYFNAVDAQNMMTIFASMLHERRILISSKKLSRLSACVQAANALIYPMHWQHIFIPVLPKHLSDYLSAPMPFLIGIPATTLARMKVSDMGDIVYLNADDNKIETPFADLEALPTEVLQSLRHDLKRPQEMLGDAVARAFLRALVKLIGGYWGALRLRPTEKITFSREVFVQSRPLPMQPFLQKMLQVQIFQQFIESRLRKLNAGQGVNDEFEFELTAHEDKTSFRLQSQYKDWVSNMKKEGGAFFKNVKTKMKDTSKKAYKDIRSRIHEMQNHTVMTEVVPEVPFRRGSVPTSFDNVKSYKKELHQTRSKENQSSMLRALTEADVTLMSPVSRSVVDSPQLTFQPVDVDLMSDLHDVIFQRCSFCSHRTSASDPQLIDLSLGDKTPCGPDCLASPSRTSSDSVLENSTPPLLPKPPSARTRLPSNSQLLIELDKEATSHIFTNNHNFSTPRSTNPFHSSPDTSTLSRSASGSNVKNLVNLWQTPPSNHKSSNSLLSPSKLMMLSRTVSTPPGTMSVGVNTGAHVPSLTMSASKVSTNPFVVADSKNNNNTAKENLNNVAWEAFH